MDDLKNALKEGKLVFGTTSVLRRIRQGKIEKVFLAKNAPKEVKEEIEHLKSAGKFEVKQMDMSNEEIGLACKKPFGINVLCY